MNTNLLGTQRMLEVARKKDCKFVYVSTSHVYGKPLTKLVKEGHPKAPLSVYAASKLGAEVCCEIYAKNYGMDICILRPFSVYGTNEKDYFVIPRIISQMIHNNVIKLGNLHPKRDFVYVTDVAKAIELVIRKSKGLSIYNIGTGKSHSILEICKMLKNISGLNKKIISTQKYSRIDDIDNIIADISKITKIGWSPSVSLYDGLANTFFDYVKT